MTTGRLLLFLTLFLIALAALARPYELIPHVYTLDIGQCSLDYYTPPAQPQGTLTAACPGRDMLRLWPWPPVTPWDEDHDRPQPWYQDKLAIEGRIKLTVNSMIYFFFEREFLARRAINNG